MRSDNRKSARGPGTASWIPHAQARIDAFARAWQVPMFQRCNTDQKLAVWCLWTYYVLGLRSLTRLYAANDISGCYVMARCCLEYDVAISAIANDPALGSTYVEYDAHARKRLLELARSGKTGDDSKFHGIETYMKLRFKANWPEKARTTWYKGGFPELCKRAEKEDHLSYYIACCQVVHGTITGAMSILDTDGLLSRQDSIKPGFRTLTEVSTLNFLGATKLVVNTIHGELWSPDKQRCEKALDDLANPIVESARRADAQASPASGPDLAGL